MEVFEEGFGLVQLTSEVPMELLKFLIYPANPLVLLGHHIKALMLEFPGEGFSAWYNRFWAKGPVILKAQDARSVLELRIAWRHQIKGKWDGVEESDLPPYYFQLCFTPHVATRAIFEAPLCYQTFDIHFDLSFLVSFGLDYKVIDQFIERVRLKRQAELSRTPYKCTREMITLIQFIINSDYSEAGKRRQLTSHVQSILTAALEEVSREEGVHLPITPANREALREIKHYLDTCELFEYPGTDKLIALTTTPLPPFKFRYGFRRLFGETPEEYFLIRRFTEAQRLLARGHSVTAVAYELGYKTPKTFIKEFNKRFGVSPGKWMAE